MTIFGDHKLQPKFDDAKIQMRTRYATYKVPSEGPRIQGGHRRGLLKEKVTLFVLPKSGVGGLCVEQNFMGTFPGNQDAAVK